MDFIARRIDSVPHLEALLLLSQDPLVVWDADTVSRRVYVSSDRARIILQDLARHGLIGVTAESAGQYRYDGTWDEGQLMQTIADSYRRHLVRVADFIHTKAASDSVKDFARAFKFKHED